MPEHTSSLPHDFGAFSASPLRFGRAELGDLRVAESREWIVTNGIGGYASGTIAGSISRGYHGLLVASVRPPVDRRILVVKLDETLLYAGRSYELGCNRWAGGSIAPQGNELIESFELQGSVPCWRYACADALVDKRVWMEHGSNTTFIAYTIVAAAGPVSFSASAIVDNRVFHNTGQVNTPSSVRISGPTAQVAWDDPAAPPVYLGASSGTISSSEEVFRNYQLTAETRRGLRDVDDHVHAATLQATLAVGEMFVIAASTEVDTTPHADALKRRWDRDASLLARWKESAHRTVNAAPQTKVAVATQLEPPPAIGWVEQLVLAADQFIVARASPEQPDGKSVIAGYHWFEDWGRDTMISLPGLTVATGRPEIAAPILRTFARFVSEGMLPNRFPDGSDVPQYNTMDAALWYFQAIAEYHEATGDDALLTELFGVLDGIVQAHVRGTRYEIQLDPSDGLLRGGVPGVQLTWMDAKVGDWVVTPRIGKPVEVNALWYNALRTMEGFAQVAGKSSAQYKSLADKAAGGFRRFWNEEKNYCYDVLDGPNGAEEALRPNQLLAVSLPHSPLVQEQQKAVVDACAGVLLTSHGLRSLSPESADYRGSYGGDQHSRDSAYHQGTTWGWLAGPFITAHLRVHGDVRAARRFLQPLADSLRSGGLGTISEIFDGNPPFDSRGCIAQAWSVGEVLRTVARIKSMETGK